MRVSEAFRVAYFVAPPDFRSSQLGASKYGANFNLNRFESSFRDRDRERENNTMLVYSINCPLIEARKQPPMVCNNLHKTT